MKFLFTLLALALVSVVRADVGAVKCESSDVLGEILVAAASANSGSRVVQKLSEDGYKVRAMVRDEKKGKQFENLTGVTVVVADMDKPETLANVMKGVKRALLVTSAFAHEQFDRETDFLLAAKAAGVTTVRISTATCLMAAGTQGAYGRAHHCIEDFATRNDVSVVNIRSNWFFDNWLGSAGEAKVANQISWPVDGNGSRSAMLDVRDLASACALILTLSDDQLSLFVKAREIEVHGPELVNFAQKAEVLSKAVGYTIKVNKVPGDAWQATLESYGIPRTFARSFLHTVEDVAGAKTPVGATPQTSSPLLTSFGWAPKYTLEKWANSDYVLAAFKK